MAAIRSASERPARDRAALMRSRRTLQRSDGGSVSRLWKSGRREALVPVTSRPPTLTDPVETWTEPWRMARRVDLPDAGGPARATCSDRGKESERGVGPSRGETMRSRVRSSTERLYGGRALPSPAAFRPRARTGLWRARPPGLLRDGGRVCRRAVAARAAPASPLADPGPAGFRSTPGTGSTVRP